MADIQSHPLARWSLQGYNAVVTGATRGIGKGIVEELAALGASVYTCARSDVDLEQRLKTWKESGLAVEGSVCDVTKREARIQLMQKASDHFGGKLDILVNNVGIYKEKPAVENQEDDFAFIISTNLESAYHLSQLAYPLLKESGKASIVFISSVVGFVPADFPCSLYSMSKGAMNQLTKSLAKEWAKDSIRVNSVAPGLVITENIAAALKDPEVAKRSFFSDIPMGRGGYPEEIGSVVAFFCMPCSSFCTGEILVVDGGTMVRGLFPLD